MIPLAIIGAWVAVLAIAWAIFRAGALADERLEQARADRLDALDEIGDTCDAVVFDFSRRYRR